METINTSFYTINGLKGKLNKMKSCLENEIEDITKIYGMQQSSSGWEVHSYTGLHHETRKIPDNLTLHLQELEKRTNKT